MPSASLSAEELRELDEARSEMDRGVSLTLGEFNRGLKPSVQRNRTS